MDSKCCAGDEAKASQQNDAVDAQPAMNSEAPMNEDIVKGSPAAGTEKKSKKHKEFTIKLNKREGGPRLGIDVDLMDGSYLLIDKINEGLVDTWNQEHPDMEVKANDHVMAVNGIRGDAQAMTEACKNNDKLEMLIKSE
mmetsp:Transcript_85352/g.164335  ORF Transcript_85352/g.164335 Transcript_85352/m.164335 type:complete len:139 (+) Transcript_85352:95-511(+)